MEEELKRLLTERDNLTRRIQRQEDLKKAQLEAANRDFDVYAANLTQAQVRQFNIAKEEVEKKADQQINETKQQLDIVEGQIGLEIRKIRDGLLREEEILNKNIEDAKEKLAKATDEYYKVSAEKIRSFRQDGIVVDDSKELEAQEAAKADVDKAENELKDYKARMEKISQFFGTISIKDTPSDKILEIMGIEENKEENKKEDKKEDKEEDKEEQTDDYEYGQSAYHEEPSDYDYDEYSKEKKEEYIPEENLNEYIDYVSGIENNEEPKKPTQIPKPKQTVASKTAEEPRKKEPTGEIKKPVVEKAKDPVIKNEMAKLEQVRVDVATGRVESYFSMSGKGDVKSIAGNCDKDGEQEKSIIQKILEMFGLAKENTIEKRENVVEWCKENAPYYDDRLDPYVVREVCKATRKAMPEGCSEQQINNAIKENMRQIDNDIVSYVCDNGGKPNKYLIKQEKEYIQRAMEDCPDCVGNEVKKAVTPWYERLMNSIKNKFASIKLLAEKNKKLLGQGKEEEEPEQDDVAAKEIEKEKEQEPKEEKLEKAELESPLIEMPSLRTSSHAVQPSNTRTKITAYRHIRTDKAMRNDDNSHDDGPEL